MEQNWPLNGMKFRWYSVFSFLFFCFEPTVEKNTWMRTISIKVMVIISKVLLWKLLDTSYFQSPFSTIMRHIDNAIWKTPCNWRFCGHASTYLLILSWVSIMKWKWAKVPGKLSFTQKSEPAFWRTFHLLLDSSFSLKKN